MRRSILFACVAVLGGCASGPTCPEGTVATGDLCTPISDASALDGGHADGAVDAGAGDATSDAGTIDAHVADAFVPVDTGFDACVVSTETCNERDDDCDGMIDEELKLAAYYDDLDGDGFAPDGATPHAGCSVPPGFAGATGDCDDTDAARSPDAAEVCDGVDQDCDGTIDDGVLVTFYDDIDGDSYGADGTATQACAPSPGHSATMAGDCNDTCVACHPGGVEVCDGLDENCALGIDEGVLSTFYADADGDGHGSAATTVTACAAPAGYVASADDCNDTSPIAYPGAAEVCNHADDDCDGSPDDGLTFGTYYVDTDGDTYAGTGAGSIADCARPDGYTTRAPTSPATTDCFPDEPRAFPTQPLYFTTPIPGAPVARAYDFNCDTVNTHQYPVGGTCSGVIPCTGTTGAFVGAAPMCGALGTFQVSCALDATFTCRSVTDTRLAPCR
jgi:hypothetical protein